MTALNSIIVRMIQRLNEIRDTHECSDVMREILLDDVEMIYRLVNKENEDD